MYLLSFTRLTQFDHRTACQAFCFTVCAGCTGWFLKAMVGLSALPVLTHIVFHVTLFAIATDSEPYGSMLPNCE